MRPKKVGLQPDQEACNLILDTHSSHQGWLLKEAKRTNAFHKRYFAITQQHLSYFKMETVKINYDTESEANLGVNTDQHNVVTSIHSNSQAAQQKTIIENDVIIALNGNTIRSKNLQSEIEKEVSVAKNKLVILIFSVLRQKARLALKGASVTFGGARKQGEFSFSVHSLDASMRRLRHTLVSSNEGSCLGWVSALNEAIASAAMSHLKPAICEALDSCLCGPKWAGVTEDSGSLLFRVESDSCDGLLLDAKCSSPTI